MWEIFIAALAALFTVVNPLGAVPVFLAMTPHYTQRERLRTARATSLYFTLILLSFFFGGVMILSFFGISINAMRIAGGIVIFISGYTLLSGKFAEGRAVNKKVREEALEKEDISFSPLAMPLLSGPGSISLLISQYSEFPAWSDRFVITGSILAMGVIIYLILQSAPYLFRLLGMGGLKALSRIMGFIVMAIGIQYIIAGVVLLVEAMA